MYRPESETEDLKIILKDGRELGYCIYGNPMGYPIFYFHGFPGSRFEGKMFDQKMKDSPFAIYALDRPGIGLSSPQKHRTLLTWADDVLDFANTLKFDHFTVMGISGGGPYSLACAYKIPSNRLDAALVVSGMGPLKSGRKHMVPFMRIGLLIARASRFMFRPIYRLIFYSRFKTEEKATQTMRKMTAEMILEDKNLFHTDNMLDIFIADNYHGYVQGPSGTCQDVEIYARSWGFELKKIPKDIPVMVIHGEKDDMVPVQMGKYVAANILHSYSKFYPEGTHFTTAVNHLGHILTKLVDLLKLNNTT